MKTTHLDAHHFSKVLVILIKLKIIKAELHSDLHSYLRKQPSWFLVWT